MGKDMHEEAALRFEPVRNAVHQLLPVAHVLKHLHRDHPIKPAFCFEAIHVGCLDIKIGQTLALGAIKNRGSLALRI